MGTVYLASDLALDGLLIALKQIHPSLFSEETVSALKSEFGAMSQLRHPNVVEVYDFSTDQRSGRHFLTMEYIEGQDLAAYLGARRGLSAGEISHLLVQVCRGLQYIHDRGLLHNDLKAQNILVEGSSPASCKLLDFGLASRAAPRDRPLRGTLQYLAPELIRREQPTRLSDLYALGIVSYLALAGRLPFEGSPDEVLRLVTTTEPAPPSRWKPDLPSGLEALVLRLLSKDPGVRPPSAAAVIRDLSRVTGIPHEVDTPATIASYARTGSLVGRDKEIRILSGMLGALFANDPEDASARLILLSGESGIGKSRLIRHLRYETQMRGGSFASGQCYEDSAEAYHPFLQVLRQILPETDHDEMLAPLSPIGAADPGDDRRAEPERAQRQAVDAAVHAILRAVEGGPLVLCIEDIQWADTASLQLLEHLARNTAGAHRLMVLASYRSEDAGSEPLSSVLPRLRRASPWERMELTRLGREDVSAMLAGMFGIESPPASLVDLIARETEGNPFHVQVAIESLLEEHPAPPGADRLSVLEGLGEIPLPSSVSEAIGRRLSRLEAPETRVMEALAVAERPVDQDLLLQVLGAGPEATRPGGPVGELVRRRLVRREVADAGTIRMRIDHVRIRNHVYESMDWGHRRELHGDFGRALEAIRERDPGTVGIEELAHHFLNSPDMDRALAYAEQAGVHAKSLCASERAISFLERAVELVPPADPPRRLRLQLHLGDAYLQARDHTRAVETYERLIKGARGAGDKDVAWTGTARLLDARMRGGQHDEAQRIAERLIPALEAEGERRNRATCLLVLANIAAARGKLDEAKKLNEEALDLRREIEDRRGVAACLNNLGLLDMLQGPTLEGRALLEESLGLWQELSDAQRASEVLDNLGAWYRRHGDLAEAATRSEEAAAVARKRRDRLHLAQCQSNLAAIYHAQGRMDRALQAARSAVENAAALGLDSMQCEGLDFQGMIERDLGRTADATACHERAIAIAKRSGLPGQEAYALTSLALDQLAAPGKPEPKSGAARDALRRAEKLSANIDSPRLKARLHEASAREKLAAGEQEAAMQHAQQALEAAGADGWGEYRAAAQILIADCLLATGKPREAADAARLAVEVAEARGLAEPLWKGHFLLALGDNRASRRPAERQHLAKAAEVLRRTAEGIDDEPTRLAFVSEPRRAEVLRKAEVLAPQSRRAATAGTGEAHEGALGAIYEITEIINSMADLEVLLDRVLDVALDIVGAERGLIILIDEVTGDQRVAAAKDLEDETLRDALSYSHSVVKEAASGHVMVALDAVHDDRFRRFESVNLYSIKSLMCVPMKIHDRIIGTVYVDSRSQGVAFGERDLKFLEAFSNLAAGAVEQARLHERVATENLYLRREAGVRNHYQNIIGKNVKMQAVYDMLERVSASSLPVLVQGESGTGKELVARALHYSGPRRSRKFLSENVAAIPETLLESEMFGHVRGAFTGAERDHKGLFEQADGGTLFLDEIGDMSMPMQSKLLRALQEGEIRPIGAKESRRVDVRIVSASNKDLDRLLKEGKMREDLYYRLNVVRITLPPLRERKEDIPLLVEHFLKKLSHASGAPPRRMEVGALQLLLRYSWPGNVRELENEVQRLAVLCSGESITQQDIMESGELFEKITSLEEKDTFTPLEELERRQIEKALMEAAGHRGRAAELLGISRATIFRKLRKFRISH